MRMSGGMTMNMSMVVAVIFAMRANVSGIAYMRILTRHGFDAIGGDNRMMRLGFVAKLLVTRHIVRGSPCGTSP